LFSIFYFVLGAVNNGSKFVIIYSNTSAKHDRNIKLLNNLKFKNKLPNNRLHTEENSVFKLDCFNKNYVQVFKYQRLSKQNA